MSLTPRRVTWLGVFVNLGLCILKIGVGVLVRAQVLVADGLHSLSDLVTDAAVLTGLRFSSRPADEDHPFGHRRVTTLVTMFIGVVLLVSAGWIVYRAVATYAEPHEVALAGLGFWVAAASIVPKELLYRVTRGVGLRVHDASLIANAWHHRTDAFTSVAAAAGLAGIVIGGPSWGFLDHITAAVLAAFLAVAAVRLMWESVAELTDAAPAAPVVGRIAGTIRETPGVLGFQELRVRKLGGALGLDVRVLVDPKLSVVEGHDVATHVHERVLNCGCEVVEAIVHIEPLEGAARAE